jgi:hypothetical protein
VVSKHWNPDPDIARAREVRRRSAWPQGATAGLAMLAAGCVAVAALLYRIAGPRDVFGP